MDARPTPVSVHLPSPSHLHDAPHDSMPLSPQGLDLRLAIQPPPPSPHIWKDDAFNRQRRQIFESSATSTPQSEHMHSSAYSLPAISHGSTFKYHRQDTAESEMQRREGHGTKVSRDEVMNGDVADQSRGESHNSYKSNNASATLHQHSLTFGVQNHLLHATAALPGPPLIQHAPDEPKLGSSNMYQVPPTSRSPPPPSPYGTRSMLPPGSPQYAQSYGQHGSQHPHSLPSPFSRDPGTSVHRPSNGMSISSMLGDESPRPPQMDQRYVQANGGPYNARTHSIDKESQRGGASYSSRDGARSQTPDAYRPRQYDYTRPSRAMSGGEAQGMPVVNGFAEQRQLGPPLPNGDLGRDPHTGGQPVPINSAPQSRRASVGAGSAAFTTRPATSFSLAEGPRSQHATQTMEHPGLHRAQLGPDARYLPQEVDGRNGGPPSQLDARLWPERDIRQDTQLREGPALASASAPAPKPVNYPFFSSLMPQPSIQPPYRPVETLTAAELAQSQPMGHQLPVYGPMPRPTIEAPPLPEYGPPPPGNARKTSIDSLPSHMHSIESPLQRHRHLMDRTSSTNSEHISSRLLSMGSEHRRRAVSPLPQAVQGAQAPMKGPASEPSIKNEFGRMFAGLGGVTPTPTPVELAHKRFSSPPDEPDRRNTPLAARFDLSDKPRSVSRDTRRIRKSKDDIDTGSPMVDSISSRGLKRTRNSYIDTSIGRLQRTDTGSPFSATAKRSFTPTLTRAKPERRPKTVITSKLVLGAVKDKPRQHLGSMLYSVRISPEQLEPGEESNRIGYISTPTLIPRFEEKENCTFTVRVPRNFMTRSARLESCERRALWGTEVYTDDTDPIAAAIHSGWIKGAWAGDIDMSSLNLGPELSRQSMSVTLSPELMRKSLGSSLPVNNCASPSLLSISNVEPDILETPPHEPLDPPHGKDCHITLLILPRLQMYASTVQHGIKSRSWLTPHDGVSYKVHKIQWVDEARESRRSERGAQARHTRLRDRAKLAAQARAYVIKDGLSRSGPVVTVGA